MSDRFGNLGDLFPDKEEKCRVRGCNNLVHISADDVMKDVAHGRKPQPRMCNECLELYKTLEDKEMPCDKPGCEGTWTWTRFQQLNAIKSGHANSKPHGFCASCQGEIKGGQDKQIPCRMKGCTNTWTLTAREQMALGDKPVPHKLCDECFKILNTLQDKELKCRVEGCDHTFVWNRFQQLEHIRAGKSIDNPPPRMCDSCFEKLKGFAPIEVPCRIKGCTHTWTYSPYEQLINAVKEEKASGDAGEKGENQPKSLPSRMCKECYAFYNSTKDEQVPCKNKLCKNTWVFTRSMQLAQKQFGHTHRPSRYCEECTKILEGLEDKQMPCKQDGCTGTWTYTKEDQLRDQTGGHTPAPRLCQTCHDFIKEHPAVEVECAKCGSKIAVTSNQQLEIKFGKSTMPELCADCARERLQAELSSDGGQASINRPKIYIPKSGDWSAVPEICKLPVRLTESVVNDMCNAEYRVVCLGDELTLSCEEVSCDWPSLLEKNLKERFGEKVSVFNAGIAGCTAEMGLKRFGRDVAPFKPQLVVLSFVYADILNSPLDESDAEFAPALAAYLKSMTDLISAVRAIGAKPLILLPNPINVAESQAAELSTAVAPKFNNCYEQYLRAARKAAGEECVVDARAMYALAGEHNAKKWMSSWYMHNKAGAMNIANWVKDEIVEGGMLDGMANTL